jgi:dihydrofolate reductase
MRKIIATEFYSLDGLISVANETMDWVRNSFDPELGKYEDELYDNSDTLLLGRVTYKIFESY